ncbi:SpoIIE family protein phosphatase [Streptomyces sp. XY006]|uniref:SpoIIE family protein phosphatase n=1 Tax=Streptomyces sp. XY006 TaxID=2021410 RepID=UPI000B8C156C|nr:SpoIIE family protein phosphatase [Streptomyces sp. XY006]OXS34579.1 phosphatase [Streptomyces sp. XY006]
MSGSNEPPADTGPVEDALGAALADTVRGTGASAGMLYLIEDAEPVLRMVALCGLPVAFTAPWQRLPLTAPVPVADAIRDDRLVRIASQDEMARRYPRAAAVLPYPFALTAAPLTGVRRPWGGLVLMWPALRPRPLTPRERDHITAIARRMARLLDDATRLPALPDQPRTFPVEVVRHPVQTGLAAADYLERLPEGALALDLEGRIVFATATAARLLGRSADRLLGTRPWQSLPWLDDPAYEDQYRTAVVSRAPLSFTALRPPDQPLTFHLYPDTSGISVRVVPGGERADAPPPASAAARPERAAPTGRLYQLVHLAAALTETVTVRDLVSLITHQILPAFGAQGLVLSSAEAGRLKITGYHGYPDDVIERLDALSVDTDLTPAGQVIASGTPAFFAHPAEMTANYPGAPRISGKQAWAFLPLIISGRPVGCCILSYDHPHPFTADERAVLTSLSGLIAQALDRARLYDAQHRLVGELQRALLPRALPHLPGLDVAARYMPAGHGIEVGGDFFDLLRLDDTTAAAVIGDVEGHSVAAAALMGQVRIAVHAHATAGATPDEVLARTDRLLADLDSELLVSCLYAHLDLARHEVSFASAGHVPPLLRHAGLPGGILDVEPGPLLGIATGTRYPVTTAPLLPGTTLALYTDGLVELPGTDAGRTTADLARHLDGADGGDLDRLIDRLVRHTAATGRNADDITVLLLRAQHGADGQP